MGKLGQRFCSAGDSTTSSVLTVSVVYHECRIITHDMRLPIYLKVASAGSTSNFQNFSGMK